MLISVLCNTTSLIGIFQAVTLLGIFPNLPPTMRAMDFNAFGSECIAWRRFEKNECEGGKADLQDPVPDRSQGALPICWEEAEQNAQRLQLLQIHALVVRHQLPVLLQKGLQGWPASVHISHNSQSRQVKSQAEAEMQTSPCMSQ